MTNESDERFRSLAGNKCSKGEADGRLETLISCVLNSFECLTTDLLRLRTRVRTGY